MMEIIALWIEAALDRLEMEPDEISELSIDLPTDYAHICSIHIGNTETFLWDIWTFPCAYWTNDYDQIAREYAEAL